MKNIKYSIFILGVIFLTSCANLDLNPLSQASSGNWFSDVPELEMCVENLYDVNFWRKDVDFWSDDFTVRETVNDITGGTINSQFAYAINTWAQDYKAIAQSNIILENLPSLKGKGTPEKLNALEGETRFVRASAYSNLISHFGDVIYYEKNPDIKESFTLSRTSKDVILKKIYEDYDFAALNLPVNYGSSQSKRATQGAALAMKARIALYMGDYETAYNASKSCIDLNIYKLNSDYNNLFLTNNAQENIFSLTRSVSLGIYLGYNGKIYEVLSGEAAEPFSTNHHLPRNRGGYAMMDPSWDLFCSFLCKDGLPIDKSPLFNPREPFKNRDPRCTGTIVEFGSKHLNIIYQPHPDSLKTFSYITGKYITNNDNRTNAQYASFNGLIWKKGIDETWCDDYLADPDKVIIRYADVLLMYAEAKIELNKIDASVLNAINQVRARAYKVNVDNISDYPAVTTTNQTELRKTLRIERRMEFAFEGLRYMDIIRWKLADKVLNKGNYGMLNVADLRTKVVNPGLWFFPSTPSIDEDGVADFEPMFNAGLIRRLAIRHFDASKQYLWPIPSNEIKINSNLAQNPGY